MLEPAQSSISDRGRQSASAVERRSAIRSRLPAPRRFEFERDSFAFANELHWEYRVDAANGTMKFTRRVPRPDYAHRCFVLARAARQFLYHARFEPTQPDAGEVFCRPLIREVMKRSPRTPCERGLEVVIPGYEHLRQFSRAREALLKSECGCAWQSYLLRSHWRMIFPISRAHQARTADRLLDEILLGGSPIVHLVRFPRLTINHGMVLFGVEATNREILFHAYDPNDPEQPAKLSYNRAARIFFLPANRYWAGGRLDVIEIYRSWLM